MVRKTSIYEVKREMNKGKENLGINYWSKGIRDFFNAGVVKGPYYNKKTDSYIWQESYQFNDAGNNTKLYMTKEYPKGAKKVETYPESYNKQLNKGEADLIYASKMREKPSYSSNSKK